MTIFNPISNVCQLSGRNNVSACKIFIATVLGFVLDPSWVGVSAYWGSYSTRLHPRGNNNNDNGDDSDDDNNNNKKK